MKTVYIGTPSYDSKLHIRFVDSYINTLKLGSSMKVNVQLICLPGSSMIASARNRIVKEFLYNTSGDDLVFIDSDISWKPEDFFKLLNHKRGAVGATYRFKKESMHYIFRTKNGVIPPFTEDELLPVEGTGMGFFRFNRETLQHLWNISQPYRDNDGNEFRAIFEFKIHDGQEIGEDVAALMKLNGEAYVDPSIDLEHIGEQSYTGSVYEWLRLVDKWQREQPKNTFKELSNVSPFGDKALIPEVKQC